MLTNTKLLNTNTKIIGVDMGKGAAITTIIFCNVGDTDETLNVYAVSNGNSPDNNLNKIISNLLIKANASYLLNEEKLILENGDAIYGSSVNGNIIATVSSISI